MSNRFGLIGNLLAILTIFMAVLSSARAGDVVVGTNIINPYALDAEEQNALLQQLKSAGVKVVRASITYDEKGLNLAEKLAEQGLKIDYLLYRFGGYEPGGPPLSAADPEQFRSTFGPILTKLEEKGITFAAFELGNEFNLSGYNSEFPNPGRGVVFGLNDLSHDPEAEQIAKGYAQYLKILAVLKDLRDHSKLNQHTPILTGGLAVYEADDGPLPKGTKTDVVGVNATVEFMRSKGLDKLVDAYAVHVYPRGNGPGDPAAAAARRDNLAKYVLKKCSTPANGKPCWITEWGFNDAEMKCPTDDSGRAKLVKEMMANFRPYVQDGRLVGLLSYAWNDLPSPKYPASPLTLYRCGGLTESGKLSLDASLLQ